MRKMKYLAPSRGIKRTEGRKRGKEGEREGEVEDLELNFNV